MGFAAGFAAGYEAVDKGIREEAARKKQIDDEAKKLKEEQDKVFNSAGQEIASHNKLVSDLTINMAKAEDETQYNTYASELKAANDNFTSLKTAKINNYKDTPLAASLDSLYSNARMSNAEQVVQTDIKDYNGKPVTVYLPESIANNKDSAILMENGKVGLAGDNNIGADGKITGYNPTNITPIKFKPTTDKYTKGLELFTPGGDSVKAYSPDEAKQYEQQGFGRIKPKIDSSPRVEVKIQQAKEDFSNSFDLGTKVMNGDKTIPIKDLASAQANILGSDFGKTESVKNLEKDSSGLYKNLMSLKTLEKDIGAIADDPAFENQYKTAFNEIITKYVPENFYSLSKEDKEAVYQSLRAKGKMGDALAKYLNTNSGTAASEKEAIRNMTNMFGGENISLMSPKSIRNSLSGFIDTRVESAKVLAEDAANSGLSLNARNLKNVIDTHTPANTKKVETPAPPVNDYEKIAKEQGKVYDPANYEYSLVNGVLKQRLIKKGN